MASKEQYAQWLVDNQDKKGTPEFNTVAEAYKSSKGQSAQEPTQFDQVTDFVRSQSGMEPGNALVKAYNPTSGMSGGEKFAAGAGKAVSDIAQGAGQMAGMVTDEQVAQTREQDAPLMESGAGSAGNIAGNVAAFAPTAMIPGANTYTGAALTGSVMGALQPVAEGESRSDNMVAGTAGGVVGKGLIGALSRGANPNTSPAVTKLMDEGVTPTPGQIVGGSGRRLEEALRSVPFVGDGIAAAESRANQQFNTAAINRVLSPIGKKIEGAGQEAIERAGKAISSSYDDILGKMNSITPDNEFTTSLQSVRQMVDKLPEDKVGQFTRILKSEITDKLDGPLSPQDFKKVQSELGRLSRGYKGSPDLDQRELGSAIFELRRTLTDLAARQNPSQSQALQSADEAYSGLLRIEDAAARNPTTEGVFSPAQLGMSSKKLDSSLRKRSTARGQAPMQEFAQTGREVLGSSLPDSGTANRLASMLAVGGGYAINPALAGAMVGGRAAYTPGGQKMLAQILAQRPESMREAGKAISRLSPLGAILGGTSTVSP